MKQAVFGAGPFHEKGSESSHRKPDSAPRNMPSGSKWQEAKRGKKTQTATERPPTGRVRKEATNE